MSEALFCHSHLTLREHGQVLVLTLHAEPMNEIGVKMLEAFEAVESVLRANPHRPLVLTSGLPNAFSAGADLRELYQQLQARKTTGTTTDAVRTELAAVLRRIHAVMNNLDRSPRLVVAHAHGVVFGGGLELALTADIVVAERSARFAFPELRLGLIPGFGGIPRLKRDVGNAVVRDLLFTGRSLGAERAYQLGLVAHLAAEGSGLTLAIRLAEQGAKFNGDAFAIAKAFSKPFPEAELEREQELFVRMALDSDVLEKALARFASDQSAQPYLP